MSASSKTASSIRDLSGLSGLYYSLMICRTLSGERKGVNKYYPPDFDPNKHRSLNAYHGTHALRERGKHADEGILTIRFEMPFNCWCLTCKNPIGMGVRYNSKKTKVGMYHSTPIYKFTMPCHLCAGTIIIQTDPQNFDYVILEGARRKEQKWEAADNEQIVMADYDEKKKLATDAMYHLEHDVRDKAKAVDMAPVLGELEAKRETLKDDFALNQLARKQFRTAKRIANEAAGRDQRMLTRLSLTGSSMKLLPSSDVDGREAKLIRLTHSLHQDNNGVKSRNNDLLFASKPPPSSKSDIKQESPLEKEAKSKQSTRSAAASIATSLNSSTISSSTDSSHYKNQTSSCNDQAAKRFALDQLARSCRQDQTRKRASAFNFDKNDDGVKVVKPMTSANSRPEIVQPTCYLVTYPDSDE